MSPVARPTRRRFLRDAACTLGLFHIVPRHVLGGPRHTAPSEVITRAVIGCGGMGLSSHVTENAEGAPPVTLAVCDVDQRHLAAALKKAGRGCDGYTDWRRMLDRRDIDTIHIATPPHWHAVMGIAAVQAGFDVTAEKPFTRTIAEGRRYADAVRRHGRIVQVNTWFRFERYYRYGPTSLLRKLVRSGLLGRPLTVRLSAAQGFDWKLAMWSGRSGLTPEPVPAELDYDMWLGPAPHVPYHPHRVHQSFRGYWDYDGGGLGDMGQHYLDPIQYILDKDQVSPVEAWAKAPWPQDPSAAGLWGTIGLRYADGDTILINSGEWGPSWDENTPLIEGPGGRVYDNYRTDPPGLFDRVRPLPDPPALVRWEPALRSRVQPGNNADVAHRSCTLVNLAKIAVRLGRPLRFDPQAERFINDDAANALVDEPTRAPWRA
ncbi:MAG: Gfo/Idh/MocA family oxidoreductase [Phycisphaerales bacterium]|nr:Gfo/Idh/MocA family oxidoreductase [Phycisphaerales bacterium]